MNKIPKPDCMKENFTKVFGLLWNTVTDQLQVSTNVFTKIQPAVTKRKVLATIVALFDPLGFLTRTTMKMTLFPQELCYQEKGWDSRLDVEDIEIWTQIMEETNK